MKKEIKKLLKTCKRGKSMTIGELKNLQPNDIYWACYAKDQYDDFKNIVEKKFRINEAFMVTKNTEKELHAVDVFGDLDIVEFDEKMIICEDDNFIDTTRGNIFFFHVEK